MTTGVNAYNDSWPKYFEVIKADLINNEYVYEGDKGLKGREAFKYFGVQPLHQHHLYVLEEGNYHLKKHLTFRDYLQKHPELVREICEFKLKIAAQVGHDRKEYQKLKEESEFIEMIVQQALSDPAFFSEYFT